jgi:hypothetical protein
MKQGIAGREISSLIERRRIRPDRRKKRINSLFRNV